MSIATRAVDERVWHLRQVQAGPKAELFILPLILERAMAMRQGGLRAHFNEDIKHIFINASDDDCIQTLKTYGGLIGGVKQLLPAMFTYRVTPTGPFTPGAPQWMWAAKAFVMFATISL